MLSVPFEDGSELVVSERATRRQVRVGLYTRDALEAELAGLGPEPLDGVFDLAALEGALKRGGQLHTLLRDQRAIAGIGRAYANEILHAARLSPFAPADRLDDEEIERLYVAIRSELSEGIEEFRQFGARMALDKKATRHLPRAPPGGRARARAAASRCSASTSRSTRSSTARPARPAARSTQTAGARACSSSREAQDDAVVLARERPAMRARDGERRQRAQIARSLDERSAMTDESGPSANVPSARASSPQRLVAGHRVRDGLGEPGECRSRARPIDLDRACPSPRPRAGRRARVPAPRRPARPSRPVPGSSTSRPSCARATAPGSRSGGRAPPSTRRPARGSGRARPRPRRGARACARTRRPRRAASAGRGRRLEICSGKRGGIAGHPASVAVAPESAAIVTPRRVRMRGDRSSIMANITQHTGISGSDDVQASQPAVHLSLSKAGVTGLHQVIRICHGGEETLYYADIECSVDLDPAQKGVHMSRFAELFAEAIESVVIGDALAIEDLAGNIATRVLERQGSLRSYARIEAKFPVSRTTPVSGLQSQEIYTLIGVASATSAGTRRAVGVRVRGLNACPCAQGMVRERASERLADMGYEDEERTRILDAIPIATHNQRAEAELLVGSSRFTPAEQLIEIAEKLDVGADPRAAQASRRALRGRAGPPPPHVRGGLRSRDGAGRDRSLPGARGRRARGRPPGELRDDPQPRRGRGADGLLGDLRDEVLRDGRGGEHLTLDAWLALPERALRARRAAPRRARTRS